MEKLYSREKPNPILFRYYENIRIAKENNVNFWRANLNIIKNITLFGEISISAI